MMNGALPIVGSVPTLSCLRGPLGAATGALVAVAAGAGDAAGGGEAARETTPAGGGGRLGCGACRGRGRRCRGRSGRRRARRARLGARDRGERAAENKKAQSAHV